MMIVLGIGYTFSYWATCTTTRFKEYEATPQCVTTRKYSWLLWYVIFKDILYVSLLALHRDMFI